MAASPTTRARSPRATTCGAPPASRHEAWSPGGGLFLAFFCKPNRFYDTEGGADISGQSYDD